MSVFIGYPSFMAYQMMKGKKDNNDGFPTIPGTIARYSALGLTNEEMSKNPVWVDKTGNGHDLQMKNFAWSGMSGVGGVSTYYDKYEFTSRILAHLSGIEYKRLTSGNYSEEEEQRILAAKEWLKTRKFTHIYIPMFDQQSIYTAVNKVKHTQGLDVLIVDYFKGKGEGDAFDSYQELGRFVDMVKNQICGEMNIAGIGAAQATITGKLADSAKIARNASTIAMISDKTPEEIEADGAECGNKKLRVTVNRNGMQMTQDEYIDLLFDGNHILYEQAKQHIPETPF